MEFDLKIISKEINEMLWRHHHTVSVAESCTAGRVASVIAAVPGSSNYFKGGLVCYSNELKQNLLKVEERLIEEKSVVSEEVVVQMVKGANELFDTDFAVAITGYAGPSGPDTKSFVSVGTIWIAVGGGEDIVTCKLEEDNGREKNLANATKQALKMLRDYLKEHLPVDEEEGPEPVIFT